MKTIYKYPLELISPQEIQVPINSVILTADIQDNIPNIWMLVDKDETKSEFRHFEILTTGIDINDGERNYINTILMNDGMMVIHIFERIYKTN